MSPKKYPSGLCEVFVSDIRVTYFALYNYTGKRMHFAISERKYAQKELIL